MSYDDNFNQTASSFWNFTSHYGNERFSLNNRFYPDNGLNSEMYRLFCSPPVENYEHQHADVSNNSVGSSGYFTASTDDSSLSITESSAHHSDHSLLDHSTESLNFTSHSYDSPSFRYHHSQVFFCASTSTYNFRRTKSLSTLHEYPCKKNENQRKELSCLEIFASNFSKFKVTTKKGKDKVIPCKFCQKNGEPAEIYNTHQVKNEEGLVTCPILQKYVCPLCGATGENAHTRKYCPKYAEDDSDLLPLFRRLSNGHSTTVMNHK